MTWSCADAAFSIATESLEPSPMAAARNAKRVSFFIDAYSAQLRGENVRVELRNGVSIIDLLCELRVAQLVAHERVLTPRGCCLVSGSTLGVVYDGKQMAHEDARQLLDSAEGQRLSLAQRLRLALDLVEGLLHVHRCGVLHGDVRAENLAVDARLRGRLVLSTHKAGGDRGALGAVLWVAPEVLLADTPRVRSSASEVYS